MTAIGKQRLRATALGAATTLAASILIGAVMPQTAAHADSVSAYLGWRTDGFSTATCQEGSWTPTGNTVYPGYDDHSERLWKGEHSDDNGNWVDRVWIHNGVSSAAEYLVCDTGDTGQGINRGISHYYYSPLTYVHRHETQVWNCNGGGCVPAPVPQPIYDDWADGTEFP